MIPRLTRKLLLPAVFLFASCSEPTRPGDLPVKMLATIAATGSAEPHLALTPAGKVVMSWLEPQGNGVALRYSVLQENAWIEPVSVASGDDWFVNWADYPSVVPISDSLWAAHWLTMTPGGVYSYNVTISISNDGGKTWRVPLTPHDDGTATEHGFVSLFPWQNAIGAVWLDGRNLSGDGHGDSHGGGMTLRSALIDHEGAISSPSIMDELVCDCCQTDVASGRSGPIAAYRNRTDGEIRDIHVIHADSRGWMADRPVADDGWKIAACPVNGPAIASGGRKVVVAWFTAANDDSQVRMAWSADDGRNFGKAIYVDVERPIGRVDIELLDEQSAVVSWLRAGTDNQGEICIRRVSESGQLGPVRVVASTGTSRASGFPQMLRVGSELVLAWTDTSGERTQVVSARVDIPALASE